MRWWPRVREGDGPPILNRSKVEITACSGRWRSAGTSASWSSPTGLRATLAIVLVGKWAVAVAVGRPGRRVLQLERLAVTASLDTVLRRLGDMRICLMDSSGKEEKAGVWPGQLVVAVRTR